MLITDLITEIALGWQSYRDNRVVSRQSPIFDLVETRFPETLRSYLADFDTLLVEGSTGRGNITVAPWVAVFDRRLTTSARSGYYVVYLFSADLSSVTLSLAFGVTSFEEQFGAPSNSFPRMRAAASRLQEMFSHLISPNLHRGPIDLYAPPRQKLHYAYQQSAILAYSPYVVGALPNETQIISDLRALVTIYREMVSDPLEPTVERLVEAVVEPAIRVNKVELRDFIPRKPRTVVSKNANPSIGKGMNSRFARYSSESRKVGDAGERIVWLYERERLSSIGRTDLAARVRWHAREGEFIGWDITSFDDEGRELFIEVKSSAGSDISGVLFTANEWRAACEASRRNQYCVYLVTKALSSAPVVERLMNPFSYVEAQQISCEPVVYELRLSSCVVNGSEPSEGRV